MADRDRATAETGAGGPPVVERTVPPGSDTRSGAVWRCKERISRLEGLLVQRRPFFVSQYRTSACHLAVAAPAGRPTGGPVSEGRGARRWPSAGTDPASRPQAAAGEVVGFAIVRPDGYLSLLGVDPGFRGRGLGSRLLARAVADRPRVACHVRASNRRALRFYRERGFAVDGRVAGYYRDGTAAYRLVREPAPAE